MSSLSAEVRAWRAAFLTIRDETLTPPSPAAALRLFRPLLNTRDALASAAPQLPPDELASDLALLLELVTRINVECIGASDTFVATCHFIHGISCKVHLNVNVSSWMLFLNFIEKMISCLQGEADRKQLFLRDSICIESILEATDVLRYFMLVHGKKCSLSENTHLVKVLLCIVSCLPMELITNPHVEILSRKVTDVGIRIQLFAVTGISDTMSKIGTSIPVNLWQCAVEVLRKVMDAFTMKNMLIECLSMSRFYNACLQCVHTILSAPKASFSEHVSGFVASLQKFFVYGLSSRPYLSSVNATRRNIPCSSSLKSGADGRKTGDGPYKPPHLRRREVQNEQNNIFPSNIDSLKCGLTSSDSEHSDNDGFSEENDRFKSSKVRIAALLCIQDICQADPKSLTSLLTILLPANDVLQPRKNQATIMTSLLFDPVLKVRISSASSLGSIFESQSQIFLQVSEYKESAKHGSFTTLSCSLGQILMQVHKGVLYVIQNETHGGLLASLFKVLLLLVAATPYFRMPPELLPFVIVSLRRKIVEEFSSFRSDPNTMACAFSCMSSAFLISPPSMHVLELLKREIPTGSCTRGNPTLLDVVLQFSQGNLHSNVRCEALKVLQAISHNYPYVTSALWEPISTTIHEILGAPVLEDSCFIDASSSLTGDTRNVSGSYGDKCKIAAVKALDCCLRASSGFKGVDAASEYNLVDDQFSIDCSRQIKVSSAPSYTLNNLKRASDASFEYSNGTKHWSEALKRHFPLILKHNSPLVRAATLTCFAGLTSSVFFSLTEDNQNLIISSVVDFALNDGVPSVRSAGCRALGVLSSFSQIFCSKKILDDFIHTADVNLHDSSLSVRITASWALANICDSLRRMETDLHLDVSDHLVDSNSISLLIESSLKLTSDSDKVKANAVRALGNLSRFVKFTEYYFSQNHLNDSRAGGLHWLERMVQAFVSCVTTGNVKVQWNVCYSLGYLFLNPTVHLHKFSWSSSVFTILLLLLRDSTNFKIRIHAAVALAVPPSRLDYGSSYPNIVQGIILVLENLGTDVGLVPSNPKYRDALEKQLALTALHVLGFCTSEDDHALKCFLIKKAPFLEELLRSHHLQFSTNPANDLKDSSDGERVTQNEPMKAIISKAIRSLSLFYRSSSNFSIASTFEKLLDDLS